MRVRGAGGGALTHTLPTRFKVRLRQRLLPPYLSRHSLQPCAKTVPRLCAPIISSRRCTTDGTPYEINGNRGSTYSRPLTGQITPPHASMAAGTGGRRGVEGSANLGGTSRAPGRRGIARAPLPVSRSPGHPILPSLRRAQGGPRQPPTVTSDAWRRCVAQGRPGRTAGSSPRPRPGVGPRLHRRDVRFLPPSGRNAKGVKTTDFTTRQRLKTCVCTCSGGELLP